MHLNTLERVVSNPFEIEFTDYAALDAGDARAIVYKLTYDNLK